MNPNIQDESISSPVTELRQQLFSRGYRPLAVYHSNAPVKCPGKRPFGDKWEKRARADIPAVLAEPPNPIATNTGILCDGLRAVDLDIDDETVVNQVFELAVDTLGDAPVRMRPNTPRLLLLYRAAVGEPGKIKIKGRDHSKERSMAVEILGHGQQFVAYGDHPSGVQLQWDNGDPSTIDRTCLTAITEEQIYEFLEKAARLIGHVPIDPLVSQSDYKDDRDWTDEEVRELIDYIPAYCADDRDLWIAIGQGLKAGGFSFNHFDSFSAQCTAKYKHNECLKTWNSLRPNDITFGTVVYWAKEGGWEPKPKAPQPTGHYKFDDDTTGFEDLPLRGKLPQALDDEPTVGPRPKPRRLRWPVEYLNLPPIDYWDDDQLFPRNPDGCTMMVVADFGNHKSNFVLSFCMNACLDKNARVLFIPCEGAYGLCTQRIPAHCADRGIPVDALTGRFGIIPEGLSLLDEKGIDGLIEESRDFNPSIIVIDTLGQAANGVDLNSSGMGDLLGNNGPVGKIKRVFKSLIIIPCHYGKDKGRGILGHTSISANTEVILEIDFSKSTSTVTATCTRQKDGPEGRKVHYSVPKEGVPILRRIAGIPSDDEIVELAPDNPTVRIPMLEGQLLLSGAIEFESGLSDRHFAERLVDLNPPIFETADTETERKTAIAKEAKRLSNAHTKKAYQRICDQKVPKGSRTDKLEWRWFLRGDPETVKRHAEKIKRLGSASDGTEPEANPP